MKTTEKTNALRIVESAGIPVCVHAYETADGLIDGKSMAQKIAKPQDMVFKTLVTVYPPDKLYFVFVVPVSGELDLKRAASAAKVKSVEMLPLKQLFPLTGYVHGGCSPVGMKKSFPTFIDESALCWDSIVCSAGKLGLAMEVPPESLRQIVNGEFSALVREN